MANCRYDAMSNSSSLVYGTLVEAHVILEEVQMAISNSGSCETEENVQAAYEAIGNLIQNRTNLDEVSEDLDYQKLVKRLSLKAKPIDPEKWNNARLD